MIVRHGNLPSTFLASLLSINTPHVLLMFHKARRDDSG